MSKPTTQKIAVLSSEVRIATINDRDFICLTDIARHKGTASTDDLIRNWLRNRNTLAGINSFTLTPKQWIERTGAIGLQSKSGRYGGTYAHSDIAFEFAAWISVEFKLYLIKEFQRLKESERQSLCWDIRRNLAKINYRIHTDAIQTHLIPPELNKAQTQLVYASEADVLNMALFGHTAAPWRAANPGSKGNIRDQATGAQLVCLANLETLNALFISQELSQSDRLTRLNQIAIQQMQLLSADARTPQLPEAREEG
jgi:hypothetical protein